jgi:two-component system sensor histidine kinase AlgZ
VRADARPAAGPGGGDANADANADAGADARARAARRRFALRFGAFAAFVGLVMAMVYWPRPFRASELALVFGISLAHALFGGLPAALAMRAVLARAAALSGAARGTLATLTACACACLGAAVVVTLLTAAGVFRAGAYAAQLADALRVALPLGGGIGLAVYAYESSRSELARARAEVAQKALAEERALALAREAQLASLAARVRPHFLFNTLNTVAHLVREDPALAEKTVEGLGALLRFSLDAHERDLVPLGLELEMTAHYLSIQRARFGRRLRYELDVPPALEGALVPPLSAQTLVENSVKYAAAARREGSGVRVIAREEGGSLRVEVSDDGPGVCEGDLKPGHGLDLLRSRLAALFGPGARLELGRDRAPRVAFVVPLCR